MAYGIEETDEEMERRLLAEIEARAAAANIDEEADESDDVIAEITGRPATPSVTAPERPGPAQPATPERPVAPTVSRTPQPAPAWARGLAPATSSQQLAQPRGGTQRIASAVERPVQMAEQRAFDRQIGEQERLETEGSEQARREARRRRILNGLAIGFAAMGGGNLAGAFASGARIVRTDGADQRDAARTRIGELRQQRQQQQTQRRADLVARLEQQRRQANEDRDFGLQQQRVDLQRQGVESLTGHRTAQQGLGERSLELREGTQEWRESQAELERDAREVRARIIAGQQVGPGSIRNPGGSGAPMGEADIGGLADAPIIRAYVQNRPELMEIAREEETRLRASGVEANAADIAWAMGVEQFGRLPRKQQDMIRRQYIAPETTNAEAATPVRQEQRLQDRVRQYGQESRDRVEWERAVNTAAQSIGNVTDAELRAAQQWIQGGAARQSIAAALAPRAEQIGETISTLQNIMLRERSGAAVTDQEFQRLRGELGSNWWSSPESLRRAVGRLRATNDGIRAALGAEYGLDVVEQYEANRQAVRSRGGRGQPAPTDSGGERVIGRRVVNGQTIEMVQRADGSRFTRRAQ
jgi:hypothetical protein